jgi:putative addiction module killer protein
MIIIKEYIDSKNQSPYARWFNRLNAAAAARVATTLIRMEHGNLSNTKRLGGGVLESRIDFGPGYRIYSLLGFNTPQLAAYPLLGFGIDTPGLAPGWFILAVMVIVL